MSAAGMRADAERATREAVAALQRGDAPLARRLLLALVEREDCESPPWFLLAQACRHAGDPEGEVAALDKVLAAQPRHVAALIMRGDCHVRGGDRRAAASFYQIALKAAPAAAPHSPLLAQELRRAEAAAAELSRDFVDHLESRLREAGAGTDGRVGEALDILLGRKPVYLQQPTSFYFPGLPQITFYERKSFPWLAALEAEADAIRAELEAVMAEDSAFRPYVEADPNRPPALNRMLGDPSWSAFHLYQGGLPHPENAVRCPGTIAALGYAPLPRIRGRSPMALFSLLRPGAHIAPHTGLLNTRLICHLPLIVPEGCALRVGNQVRPWRETLIFDDSIEHEAWNRSAETRVILLFEIWRPELSRDERAALTALFEAITDFGGGDAELEA
jgi:aspartyl/asparaginyl beta-hydroxylase (cupin superfamily)